MPSRIGEIFGSYELIQFLGRGGFAEVYLGKHTQLPQQMAAIKILDKQLIIAKSQQFQKEASIVATLRHPNIVQMYDYNVYSNLAMTTTLVPYIVMEYAPNKSLRVKHQRGLALPIKTVITYARQIADALQYAHDQGVMHLDVKPENILINTQNKLLLSDFGLATLLSEKEKTGDIQGTLSYMSPEQLDGKPGFASDQYALSVMVYEWISGHMPFTGQSVKEVIEKHLKASPPSLCAQVSTLSAQAEDVIFKALEKNVADRFPTIEAFADSLDQALSLPRSKMPAAQPQPQPAVNPTPGGAPQPPANPVPPFPLANPASAPNANPLPLFPAANPAGTPPANANPLPPFPLANPAGAPNANPLPLFPAANPAGGAPANAHPLPLFPAANPGIQPGLTPPYPNAPAFPGNANPAVSPTPVLPVTPPNNWPAQGATPQGYQPLQLHIPPPPPGPAPAGVAAPAQANPSLPSFPFPVNQQPGNSFLPMNTGGSPFQAGPPPGMLAPAPLAGAGSPFLNTMPGSPSSTTVFGLPGAFPAPESNTNGPVGPGPLPPYLGGGTTGQYMAGNTQEKGLSQMTKTFLKRPPATLRRRRLPLWISGLLVNGLGAIFIGFWMPRIIAEHDIGWWAFIFSIAFSLGAFALFFNSGNRALNIFLSAALAVYWGFVGNALGDLTSGSFLPGPAVLAFLFFGISLVLHLYLASARK